MADPLSPIGPVFVPGQPVDHQRTDRLQGPQDGDDQRAQEVRLRKSVQDFESLFIYKLLKTMRATVPQQEGTGFGMETMREITDEQLAVFLARQGGIGLGEMLYQALNQQKQQSNVPTAEADSAKPATAQQISPVQVRPKFRPSPDRLTIPEPATKDEE
jgi:flagellar protein FlgJ